MKIYSFEKLNVWKAATDLVGEVYRITKVFLDDEKFGSTSQLRRASISIASNIAEGTSRCTNKDKAHFTTIAFSSAIEVLNQLIISNELNYLNSNDYISLREQIEKITNMLNALRDNQLNA